NLRAQTMPPADEPQPTADERGRLIDFVSRDVLGVDPGDPDPGRVVLRRLNRVEYANTVRDLTGVDEGLADELPADDTGHGFDTVADVLTLSPLLLEKYVALAARVGDRVAADGTLGRGPGDRPSPLQRLFPDGPPPAEPAVVADHLRRTLHRLAERAFRRPVDADTVDRLMAVVGPAPQSFEQGLGAAVTAVLSSPRFLFRLEDDTAEAAADAKAVPIDEYALATRLSYFLWSTMPDDVLFELAAHGRLRGGLAEQVTRMVSDPRNEGLVRNFVGQWLQTRDVEGLAFDARRILGTETRDQADKIFSGDVRRAMRQETELRFAHVLRAGLPATDLLVGGWTFLNGPLAMFYGIPGVKGRKMRLVELPADAARGGLLGHGSVLVVTSNPTRTSPVKRGAFILDNLLGTPSNPAPPDVPTLEAAAAAVGGQATMRELMAAHRGDALCASCHARMDPLGLALERYDALGRWRDDAAGQTIDTAGRLITGETFADARQLAELIAGPRRRDFHRCLTEKMLTYALGRGLEYFDGPAVDTIVEALERDGRLLTLVQGVVASVPFQMRRGQPGPTGDGAVP
ncbi:MAG: DUF1592 domain-containing protein, partial [Planctomycetes bacterium]|nr:DUF1592 domain-containing protein [Planctomycetota bacterium]